VVVIRVVQREFVSLSEGFHVFECRAVDGAGNAEVGVSSISTTVDTIPPVLHVHATRRPSAFSNVASQELCVSVVDQTAVLDSLRVSVSPVDAVSVGAVSVSMSNLTGCGMIGVVVEGNYTVTVNITDAAGNTAQPVTLWFVYDATAPEHSATWLSMFGCSTVGAVVACRTASTARFEASCSPFAATVAGAASSQSHTVAPCTVQWAFVESTDASALDSSCVCR
jgi:hypothetical protein